MMRPAAFLVMAALAVSSCSAKSEAPEAASADGVKVGPGITDDTITIGALGVTTGTAAAIGNDIIDSQQLVLEQVNAAGGVCERTVEMEVRDTGFDPQRAVAAYNELEPNVAGFSQLIGSQPTAALVDSIDSDEVLTIHGGYSAEFLGHPSLAISGGTYDTDAINGLYFLAEEVGLQEGDKVGHVVLEGAAGDNAVEGSTFAAEQLGLEIVVQQFPPAATDLTAQVTALQSAGVDAILTTPLPPSFASLVGVASSIGLDVPILGQIPAWAPQLMATPLAPALEQTYIVTPVPSPASEDPGVQKFIAEYAEAYPDRVPSMPTIFGAVMIKMLFAGLEKACEEGDLTRAGITKAFRSISDFDNGFGETYDFTDPGKAPSVTSYILQPDSESVGLLKEVQPGGNVDAVQEYLDAK